MLVQHAFRKMLDTSGATPSKNQLFPAARLSLSLTEVCLSVGVGMRWRENKIRASADPPGCVACSEPISWWFDVGISQRLNGIARSGRFANWCRGLPRMLFKSKIVVEACLSLSWLEPAACQGPANPHVTRLAHAPSLFVYSHRTRTLLPFSSPYWDSVDSQI